MARVAVWARRIGSGTENDPWRPDIPEGIAWGDIGNGMPIDTDPVSARFGKPISEYRKIYVWEEDIEVLSGMDAIVQEDDVPVSDRKLVAVLHEYRKDLDAGEDYVDAAEGGYLDSAEANLLRRQIQSRREIARLMWEGEMVSVENPPVIPSLGVKKVSK